MKQYIKQFMKVILTGTRQGGTKSVKILHIVVGICSVLSLGLIVVMGVPESKISEIGMSLTFPFLKFLAIVTMLEDIIFKLAPYIIIYLVTSRTKTNFKQKLYIVSSIILPLISASIHLTNLYSIGWVAVPYFVVHFAISVVFIHILVKYGIVACWAVHYCYDVCLVVILAVSGGL